MMCTRRAQDINKRRRNWSGRAQHKATRTSGYAIASAILALVGAFTLVGTVLAVLFGMGALLAIRRRKDELAGRGLALFGVLAGTLLTSMTAFALSGVEVFGFVDDAVSRLQGDETDRSGPLEVVRPTDGFAITTKRPAILRSDAHPGCCSWRSGSEDRKLRSDSLKRLPGCSPFAKQRQSSTAR